jgi:peptide/nickel transport system permease protein
MDALKRLTISPTAIVGLLLLVLVIGMALSAPVLFPKDPLGLAGRPLQWPFVNARFWLGTDTTGRDIAAQIFHGARVSLLIGVVATLLAITIGIVIGAVAGYYGGIVDDVLMRITAAARLTRAEFLSLRGREFVQACRTLGMRDLQIIFREILPNALPPVIVYASVIMATAILLESALAFLNLSDPNIPSWGNLIGAGRSVLRTQWYVSAIPGVAILLTVLSVSLVGQGLNDALNPRLKRR